MWVHWTALHFVEDKSLKIRIVQLSTNRVIDSQVIRTYFEQID